MDEIELQIIRGADGALIPATEHDRSAFMRLPVGEAVGCTLRRQRHPKYHRMTHALKHRLADNWPGGAITDEQAMLWLKLSTGLVEVIPNPETGEPMIVYLSTRFASMPQDRYSAWWDGLALPKVAAKLGVTVEELSMRIAEDLKPRTCATPGCKNPPQDPHHIFGGTFMRARSEALGYVVRVCRKCHDEAEAAGERDGMTNIEYWRRVYCKVIGVKYEAAYAAVNAAGKAERIYKLKGENNG